MSRGKPMNEHLLKCLQSLGLVLAVDLNGVAPYLAQAEEARRHGELEANAVRAMTPAVASAQTPAGVLILNVSGIIRPRASEYAELMGYGCSVERLRARIREAVNDQGIAAIVLRMDTPGGVTSGLAELHADILKAREVKPIIAMVETMCASAGYWIASACSEIVAMQSALIGSIGVVTSHTDVTAMNEQMGVKVTLVATTPEKIERYPDVALSEDAQAHLEGLINAELKLFIGAVAKGRGLKPQEVLDRYGRGRTFLTGEAKNMGMVDRIGTMESVLAGLAKTARGSRAPRAHISRSARMALL
jgi:signal peptide peptidase SppA